MPSISHANAKTAVNDFNQMYIKYTACGTTDSGCLTFDNIYNSGSGSTTYNQRTTMIDASYNALVTNLKTGISGISGISGSVFTGLSTAGNSISTATSSATYDAIYNNIIKTNLTNINKHKELELMKRELQESSMYGEDKIYNDYTIYTNIILTTLITCGVFIIFTKL